MIPLPVRQLLAVIAIGLTLAVAIGVAIPLWIPVIFLGVAVLS